MRGNHLCQGQRGVHAHRQLRVVQSLGNSTEDFAEALVNRSSDAFPREQVYCEPHRWSKLYDCELLRQRLRWPTYIVNGSISSFLNDHAPRPACTLLVQ
jgi:hypothetical protein